MFIFFTVFLIAVGLSMDTFSLSLSYGMLDINKKNIYKITFMVGLFHFIMPLIGNYIGNIVINIIFIKEELIIGIVFLILTIELFCSLFNKEEINIINSNKEILMFSLAVSIDSFTTGFGLDAINLPSIFISTIFFIVSSSFTFLGLSLGKKLNSIIGEKAKIIGILLLMILSIKYIISAC